VGFIDADGDIDAGHLAVYVNAALESDADIVLADKTHARSSNGSAAGRQVTSSVMHGVNRHLLRLSIVDTQTGAKLLRRELVQSSLPRMWENGFAFDVELFVVAQHLGYQRLLSMPVTIQREGGSTVSLKSTLRTGLRVLVIARRIAMADYYYGARSWPAEIDERVSDTSERRANAMTIPEQAQPGRVPAPRAASHGRSE
jgi:hypothetical protein